MKARSRDEQARILDLLEIFREYTEKGRIRHASTLLASQVANLENATRRLETQSRAITITTAKTSSSLNSQAP